MLKRKKKKVLARFPAHNFPLPCCWEIFSFNFLCSEFRKSQIFFFPRLNFGELKQERGKNGIKLWFGVASCEMKQKRAERKISSPVAIFGIFRSRFHAAEKKSFSLSFGIPSAIKPAFLPALSAKHYISNWRTFIAGFRWWNFDVKLSDRENAFWLARNHYFSPEKKKKSRHAVNFWIVSGPEVRSSGDVTKPRRNYDWLIAVFTRAPISLMRSTKGFDRVARQSNKALWPQTVWRNRQTIPRLPFRFR